MCGSPYQKWYLIEMAVKLCNETAWKALSRGGCRAFIPLPVRKRFHEAQRLIQRLLTKVDELPGKNLHRLEGKAAGQATGALGKSTLSCSVK